MKFLNKKEQVMDLKLTSYGHYLLSMGRFKPAYYAFYDDNVLYDGAYANISESANQIHDRIKHETQYLETQVLFQEVDTPAEIIDEGSMSYYLTDISPIMREPRKDTFRFEAMIGDAFLEGSNNIAPAWKIVTLQGHIKDNTLQDKVNNFDIPQLNITLNYYKRLIDPDYMTTLPTDSVRNAGMTTPPFADGKAIQLVVDDLLLYAEEVNTELLHENFDIEVFEIVTGAYGKLCATCPRQDKFKRKYFLENLFKLDGEAITEEYLRKVSLNPKQLYLESALVSSSVAYYFDIFKDGQISPEDACKGSEVFNRQSLYIDLDFDCDIESPTDSQYYDIYGVVTEPEICQ